MRRTIAVATVASLGLMTSIAISVGGETHDAAASVSQPGDSAYHHTSYPIDSDVVTTAGETVVAIPVPASSPWLYPYQVASYAQYGYGGWQSGPGLGYEIRLDLMPLAMTPRRFVAKHGF